MSWSIGGQPVVELWEAANSLAAMELIEPPEFARATTILNVIGWQPSLGYLLMLRRDLAKLNMEKLHDLVVDNPDGSGPVTSKGWLAIASECLTPGDANDPKSLHLLTIADGRWRAGANGGLHAAGVNQNFNLPTASQFDRYLVDRSLGDVVFGWDDMVSKLWTDKLTHHLGSYPGLPVSLTGVPVGWAFNGVSAYAAVNMILDHLYCALAPNLDGSFRIVQLGVNDGTVRNLGQQAGKLIDDAEYFESKRGKMPGTLRFHFNQVYEIYGEEQTVTRGDVGFQWQSYAAHIIDVANTHGGDTNVTHAIWSCMPAVYDPLTNTITSTSLSGCNARAAAHAALYFTALNGCPRIEQTYSGIVNVLPGSQIKGVAWRQVIAPDQEGATVTDVFGTPQFQLRITDGKWHPMPVMSTAARAPNFRPQHPLYPPLEHTLIVHKLNNSDPCVKDDTDGRFNCGVMQYDSTTDTFLEKEPCWGVRIMPFNPDRDFIAKDDRVPARLVSYNCKGPDCRAVYAFITCSLKPGPGYTSSWFYSYPYPLSAPPPIALFLFRRPVVATISAPDVPEVDGLEVQLTADDAGTYRGEGPGGELVMRYDVSRAHFQFMDAMPVEHEHKPFHAVFEMTLGRLVYGHEQAGAAVTVTVHD